MARCACGRFRSSWWCQWCWDFRVRKLKKNLLRAQRRWEAVGWCGSWLI
jgi:hypothetical protein